ncbi:MAG: sulfite exporter TauE/SafE family protein [Candidatus Hydrogenedentes bacterium]|nr:sulfite exporter TauE/SafE family protein [Candidatus Hydrogenedentota bacterium]
MKTIRKRLFPGALIAACCLLGAPAAFAHPLGDFSINQYFILDATGPRPAVHYLLDVAEIPSFTELDLLDRDFDSEVSQDEVNTYLAQRIPQLAGQIELQINGEPAPLAADRYKLILLEGNAGMVVFNILLTLESEAGWPDGEAIKLSLASRNYPDEQGTRECLVLAGPNYQDATADLPASELGNQAPVPQEAIAAPVYGNRGAAFTLQLRPAQGAGAPGATPEEALEFAWTSTARLAAEMGEPGMGAGIAAALIDSGFREADPGAAKPLLQVADGVDANTVASGTRQAPDTLAARLMNRMSAIVRTRDLPPLLFALGLLIAAALGMGHALSPGHGKTVMAAYLIGERGTAWHAIALGIVVTLTHTWSVILLGLVTLYFEGWLSEDQVNFWTGIISGGIIVAIGLVLFRRRYQQFLASAQGAGAAWRLDHGHDHALESGAPGPELAAAPSFWNVVWLGVSGGVVPCPAALIVLLLALKVGRLAYGLALILAFSLGLALVLVIIGLLVVRASQSMRQRQIAAHPLFQLLPLGSAALITLLGGWVMVWTLLQFDILRFS